SSDGTSWASVKGPAAGTNDGGGGVLDVGASDTAFLMVGQDATGVDSNGFATGPAMLWTSADGATWIPTALGPDAVARGVAAAGNTIVAGGGETNAQSGRQPLLWTSTNGTTWSADIVPTSSDCADDVNHVVAGPDGFLARSDCGTYEIPATGGSATTHGPD